MDDLLANFDNTKKQSTVTAKNSSLYESLVVEIRQIRATAVLKMTGRQRAAAPAIAQNKNQYASYSWLKMKLMNTQAIEIFFLSPK
jgi:hypothetical protein